MGYSIELKNICLNDYMDILKNQNLLPGRKILLNNIDENFKAIYTFGISNLDELYKILCKPAKLEALVYKTGINKDYLIILKREVGSFIQKPVSICDFPGLSPIIFLQLNEHHIKTSKDLYDYSDGFSKKKQFCDITGISENIAKELFALCDLVRINGVGAVFAKILYISGINGVQDLANTDADYIFQKFLEINIDNTYTKAKLGKNDMQFCIDFAKILSKDCS